ncbi:MAG TPA: redoxin domain-containing protein [Terriglobales bacterium]|nr:redoxin domain-containing protein [Terriglobales bacterium]
MSVRGAALILLAVSVAGTASWPAGIEVRLCRTLEEAAPPGAGAALLVFFSTECPVCYDGLFESRRLVEKGGWPVRVVGVASGPADSVRSFLEKFGWTQPVVHDRRRSLARRFRVDFVPDWVLLVGGEPVCRSDPRAGPVRGMEGLAACLKRTFSR